LALCAVLDGDGSAECPVRLGDGMAGDAQGAATGSKRARTHRRAGAYPGQQPAVAPVGGQDYVRPKSAA